MQRSFFRYLNFGPAEERWGLFATTVGYSKTGPHDDYPNQRHPPSHELTWNRGRILNDYYIVFIPKGKGVFGSALSPACEISAGTVFFLYPGVWHRYKPEQKVGWEEYWIGFNGFYAQQLMDSGIFNKQQSIYHTGLDKDILVLFQQLTDTVRASLPGYPQQIAGLTMQLLGHINNIARYGDGNGNRIGKLISKARFMIQESHESRLNMEKLAQELPMGYASFRKAFKRFTGESPNQYHLNLRLERARSLLTTTVLNINEIADQTGFQSVFYFSKLFKKKHGLSPKQFRDRKECLL